MVNNDVSELTNMIQELAATDSSPRASKYSGVHRGNILTPRSSRILPESTYSTPHKEPDNPIWPTRETSYGSATGPGVDDRSSRYSSINISPRKTVCRTNSSRIDDHIYTRGFLEGACSDITIRAFSKVFALHKIILDRSPFFSMMFSGPWRDSDSSSMELKFDDANISCAAFEFAVSCLYGKTGNLESTDCLNLLATAAYLDMTDLQEQCTNWQLRNLNTQNLSRVVNFVMGESTYGISSDRLREACKALLLRDGFEMSPKHWFGIPIELVSEVVASDAFFCPAEIDRYSFITRLIRERHESPEDVEVLEEILRDHIYYMHMSQAELRSIRADGIVNENILYKALWDQVDLREEVTNATAPLLGITTSDETQYQVPVDDTCYIGDPLMTPPTSIVGTSVPSYCAFPPFRFSAEFEQVSSLKEDTRVYSHTVFYAGSYWNIYIHDKFRARKSRQLGVYLHRVEIKSSAVGGPLEVTSPSSHKSESSSFPPARDAQGNLLGSMPENKRPYVDQRSTISTYFKIYCPSRRGASKIGITEFRSGPDEFHKSQSWGWKSRGLCAYDEKELLNTQNGSDIGGLKFMIVLGVV